MGKNTITSMLSYLVAVKPNVPDVEIVETIIAKRPCLEQIDSDDNDEVDPVPLITHAEAKLQILGLQCY